MKFVAISDTHGKHNDISLPPGDVLIHAGDLSMKGGEPAADAFLNWFTRQDFEHKIFIAGNHDFYFESASQAEIAALVPDNIIYLQNSGTTINGIKIWGSPMTPWFYNMAFNRKRGADIARYWSMIPDDTAILVTHGPMHGVLDRNRDGEHVGCKDLTLRVYDVQPRVHICGHIHPDYGTAQRGGIHFINASMVNDDYELVNTPMTFEL